MFSEYYFIILILQAVCVIHSMRRGTQRQWLWIIVFIPVVGCLAYIYSEIISKRNTSAIAGNLLSVVNPTGRIKKLEHNYSFSSTFANRIALADAYLQAGYYDKAIELYEPMLTGIFDSSEDALKNLMIAYFKANRFNDVVRVAPKVSGMFNFNKTTANLCYALALENIGKLTEAEIEFKKICHKFSSYEQRYNYGAFLMRRGRNEDAAEIFKAVLAETDYLSGREKSEARQWINLCRQEHKKLSVSNTLI